MRKCTLPLLALLVAAAQADAGILPEAQRENLISRVFQNFWGRAKLANGEFAQPATEQERNTVPVAKAVAHRALDTGEISGLAEWCGLDWQPNYLSLSKAARRKGLNEKQVAFVSFLHGAAQGNVSAAMAKSAPCKNEERLRVERLINQSQLRGLDSI
ncbi:MAG: hypothetical protein HYU78_01240 [Rhodocyclales bacterium]|nr:hypothetical protein [Rhodocyclales bacterium]